MFRKILLISCLAFMLYISNGCDRELSSTPPDPAPSSGKIILNTQPEGYKIYKNGRLTGSVTPDSLIFLEPGDYNIELKHESFLDTSFTANLEQEERKPISIDFLSMDKFYSSIECTSNPEGAEVVLDDSGTGLYTPTNVAGVFPGKHKIKFNKLGYRSKEYQLSLISNLKSTLNANLEDTTIWLVYNEANSQLVSNSLNAIGIYEHRVWIGFSDEGVMDISGNEWINYNSENTIIPMNFISSIGVTEEGAVMVGTIGGAAYFDGLNWSDNSELSSIATKYIIYMQPEYRYVGGYVPGRFCICTQGRGVLEFTGNNLAEFEFNSSLPSMNTTCIDYYSHYSSNMYAVGTDDAGLYVQNGFTGGGEFVYDMSNAGFISNNITATAIVGGVYNIYAGVKISSGIGPALGMLYFRNSSRIWEEINLEYALINDIIVDFASVWVATSNGLYRLRNSTQVLEHFTAENSPIESNNIYDIELDRYGNIWMATGKGLVRYKIQE